MHQSDELIKEVVLSSRIRLARNFENIPFPEKLVDERNFLILRDVYGAIKDLDDFKVFQLNNLPKRSKGVLFEKHLISKKLIENSKFGAVILSSNENSSIMICEEDHIRAQVILKGLNLKKAYEKVDKLDNAILKNCKIAYDEKLGFLTACPTNLGTGLRASVMIFLPALSISNKINLVFEKVKKQKQTIRGLYGEGSGGVGFIYQISNQATLGKSEGEIINEVEETIYKICALEFEERLRLLDKDKQKLKQVCLEAGKSIMDAKSLSINDFMKFAGLVKLGVFLNLISASDVSVFDDLIQIVQPNSLQELSGKVLDDKAVDVFRAQYCQKILKNVIHF